MAEKKLTDGSLALEEKQYRVITIEATEKPQDIKLRVAAYARVSTASDDQLNSLAAQNKYYTTLISSRDNWAMVDMYADEGITGTSADKRDDFKRMLADCQRGKIDRVLVKSISRFARNTKECLETIRELKGLGVSIYFEKENIDTATMSGEMMTALFASFAQAESESISGNMRWSYQRRMQSGEFNTYRAPYGYTLQDGELVINEDEAETVRYIFNAYLNGEQTREIAKRLAKSETGKRIWNKKSIEYILRNERYAGNALLQKRYVTDVLPRKVKYNKGEKEMYFVQGSNEPIISQETFDKAQALRQSRIKDGMSTPNPQSLSKVVYCGCCGKMMRSKPGRDKRYMVCRIHEQDTKLCALPPVREEEILNAFPRMYYKLKHDGTQILSQMLTNLQTIRNRRMLWSLDVIELNKRISDITSQNQLLATLKQQGLVDSDIFIAQTNMLTEQLRSAKLEKERLLDTEHDETITSTKELLEILEGGPDFLADFDAELFGELIDKVIVDSDESIRFRLKNGLELTESIERTVR